jgi:hypothetical protein
VTTLRLIDTFALRVVAAGEDAAPTSELVYQGAPTGVVLAGAMLEAAVAWNESYLLFLTDDIPYEDSLHIHLLDANFQSQDTASLSSIYSTGSFSALTLMPPDQLVFRFFGDMDWRVELLSRPTARVPFLSEPAGVKRPMGFSRRFIIRAAPSAARGEA